MTEQEQEQFFGWWHQKLLDRLQKAWEQVAAHHARLGCTKPDGMMFASAKADLEAAENALWRFKATVSNLQHIVSQENPKET